ncbi:hypothetical protein G7013_20965 [Pseudomonas viridiflava]|uniref:hypothetical protein n=1 Tax=Pseudomonas viridiflava TaxID=33069 RepID=UPI0015E2732F|nr:hypothetical protein [Pseudomonas viridiflava]MBA1232122.1 hypothetical protein [Pseudomonas viridiflava]
MKISAAMTNVQTQPFLIKGITSSPLPTEPLEPLPPAARMPRDPNEAFYRFEKTPWRPQSANNDSNEELATFYGAFFEQDRLLFLKDQTDIFQETICNMFDAFHGHKQQLSYLNPELAKKHYGFTLGFDEQIKVTDPDGVLTPAEHTYLTEELNKLQSLKDNLMTNAKSIMTLLDHDSKKFGTEHTLNLEGFRKVIDYGQVFSRNTIGNFMDTIIYQIERNAPKREAAQEPAVDIYV